MRKEAKGIGSRARGKNQGLPEDFWKKALAFLAKFFAIYGLLQALILVAPLQPLLEWIAGLEAFLLGAVQEGSIVLVNGAAFEIVANCSGLMGISVLAAIVFGLSKPRLKKKAALFSAGAAVLFPLNLVRVYLVLSSARFLAPADVEALHYATWFTTSAIILALWYFLAKRVAGVEDFSELL